MLVPYHLLGVLVEVDPELEVVELLVNRCCYLHCMMLKLWLIRSKAVFVVVREVERGTELEEAVGEVVVLFWEEE